MEFYLAFCCVCLVTLFWSILASVNRKLYQICMAHKMYTIVLIQMRNFSFLDILMESLIKRVDM